MGLATTIDVKLVCDLQRQRDLAPVSALINAVFQKSLADGTGANQANAVASKQYTLAASATQVVDLGTGGLTDDVGNALSFTAVKAILVKPSLAAGVQLEPNGTEGFADWVKAAGDGVKIAAGGCFLLAAPDGAGLSVSNNVDDKLLLTNLSGSVSAVVDVVIVGVATLS